MLQSYKKRTHVSHNRSKTEQFVARQEPSTVKKKNTKINLKKKNCVVKTEQGGYYYKYESSHI